jgi:hypothetical protein
LVNFKWWIFRTLCILHYVVKELFAVSVYCSNVLWDDKRLKLRWPNTRMLKLEKSFKHFSVFLSVVEVITACIPDPLPFHILPSFPNWLIQSHIAGHSSNMSLYYCPSIFNFALTNLDKFIQVVMNLFLLLYIR